MVQRWSIVSAIWQHITNKLRVNVGDRIPTEAALAQQVKVGRPRLREGLVILEQLGLLQRQRKRGTFRQKADPSYVIPYLTFYLNLEDHAGYRPSKTLDMMRVARAAIEGAAAVEAAINRTAGDLIVLHGLITQQEEAKGNLDEWRSRDCSFHQGVLTATHNPFLIELGRIVVDFFAAVNYPRRVCLDPMASKITRDHWRILEYIRKREAEKARRLMYRHVKFPRVKKTARRRPGSPNRKK